MAKECNEEGCTYPVFSNKKCMSHQYKREDEKYKKQQASKTNNRKGRVRTKKKRAIESRPKRRKTRITGKRKLVPITKLDKLAWEFVSLAYRLQDANDIGICKCATCPTELYYYGSGKMQLGHFISRRKLSTKFLRTNLAAQCAGCNGPMGGGQQFRMGKHLDETHGEGTGTNMDQLSQVLVKWGREEYKELIIDTIHTLVEESQVRNIWDWKSNMDKWKIAIVNLVMEHGPEEAKEKELNIALNYRLP